MNFWLMLVCASFLLAAGCASSPGVKGDKAMAANATLQEQGDKETVGSNLKNMAALWKTESRGDYRIGPEDVLEIDVFQVDDLKRTVTVSANGFISFPLLGQVKVAGRTAHQLETELAGQLDRYVVNPQVTVSVKEYRAQRIAVMGAVEKPPGVPGYRSEIPARHAVHGRRTVGKRALVHLLHFESGAS